MPLLALGAIGAALLAYAFSGRSRQQRRGEAARLLLPGRSHSPTAFPDIAIGPSPGSGVPASTPPASTSLRPPATTAAAPTTPRPSLADLFAAFDRGPHPLQSTSPASERVPPPTLADWSSILAPDCAASGVQLPYALRWLGEESGGNPCDVGDPRAHGPDGQPLEMGIAQLYNPDDLDLTLPALTGDELRAYCVPGNQHEVVYRGEVVRGFSTSLSRPLTPTEMRRQADGAIALIRRSMRSADRDLAGVGAGPAWGRDRADYWRLVKLQHGLPAFSREGMPATKKKLGRAPADWREFKATLGKVRLSRGAEAKRTSLPGALENAEKCASVFAERGIA